MPTEKRKCLSSRLRQVSVCQGGTSSAIFAVRTSRTPSKPAKRGQCFADGVSAGIGAEVTTGPHLVFSLISFQPVPACNSLRQPTTVYTIPHHFARACFSAVLSHTHKVQTLQHDKQEHCQTATHHHELHWTSRSLQQDPSHHGHRMPLGAVSGGHQLSLSIVYENE